MRLVALLNFSTDYIYIDYLVWNISSKSLGCFQTMSKYDLKLFFEKKKNLRVSCLVISKRTQFCQDFMPSGNQ